MLKKILLFSVSIVISAVVIAGSLALIKKRQFEAMGAAAAALVVPPTTVTAVSAKREVWGDNLSAPASLVAVQGVTVAAQVPGKIVSITFEPGSLVNAGDILAKLDTTTEEAQLRALEATADLAKANLRRAQELRKANASSAADLDVAEAQALQARAQAESISTVIYKKTLRAPFAGRLGIRLVNLGQILREGDAITTLQTLDPIYANFSLPQQKLSLLRRGTVVLLTSDAAPGDTFTGKINVISPEIDSATRNIRVQATLSNEAEKLRPGMYATVKVVLPTQAPVLVIPVTSVLYAPYGDSVFVVIEQTDGTSGGTTQVLRQQFIRIGGARGDFVSVVDGLKEGEIVVTSGVFKLRPGTLVVIDNTLALDAQLTPTPDNT